MDSPDQLCPGRPVRLRRHRLQRLRRRGQPDRHLRAGTGHLHRLPGALSPVAPGVPRTVANPNNIVSPFLQTKFGDRLALADRRWPSTIKMDTAITGDAPALPAAGQHRRPVRLRGQHGPEQLPVLLRRHGVRREFVLVRPDAASSRPRPAPSRSSRRRRHRTTPDSTTFSSGIYGRDVLLNSGGPAAHHRRHHWQRSAGPLPAANAWTIGFVGLRPARSLAPPGTSRCGSTASAGIVLPDAAAVTYYLSAINGPYSAAHGTASLVQRLQTNWARPPQPRPSRRSGSTGSSPRCTAATARYFLNGQRLVHRWPGT